MSTITCTYNPQTQQWSVDPHMISVKGSMTVTVSLATTDGSAIALGPTGFGQGYMIMGDNSTPNTQFPWMTDLQTVNNSTTAFSFTDTDPSTSWDQKYHFVIGYKLGNNPLQYTPDPTIMNLDPSGTGYEPRHEAARA